MSSNIYTKYTIAIIWTYFCITFLLGQVPQRPSPPKLLNDFATVFTQQQQNEIEILLEEFSNKTSNQIAIVTLIDFAGSDKALLAYEIGQTWGVGSKEFNNGIVILIKPKNETRGEVFIATGYGLEGALPDAICKNIIEYEMLPLFKENNYYGGVKKAIDIITKIAQGEHYEPTKPALGWADVFPFLIIAVLFVGMIIMASKNSGGRGSSFTRAGVAAAIFSGLSSSAGRSSGSGGGFGGFGGGSFGGGGAGGSW